MCGIAGIIDLNHSDRANSFNLELLSKTLRHRGPDDEGFIIYKNNEVNCYFGDDSVIEDSTKYSPNQHLNNSSGEVGFVHRRLSIIDLSSAGHQPMCDSDEHLWITYNGEIYNYLELRNELRSKGYHFTTNTDTEVILNAFKEWRFDCVNHFNGMWSFVILDTKEKQLFGSRDRTGVKPFYYHNDNKSFSFASEQKALTKLEYITKNVNPEATLDFLLFNKVEHRDESIFNGIFELLPSHSFTLNLKTSDFKKWKYYNQKLTTSELPENEIIEKTKNILLNSIQLRLRSDVEVGSCLSGGIDSSSIVGMVNSIQNESCKKIKTFSCIFEGTEFDESNYAKAVAEFNQLDAFYTSPTSSELLTDLEDLIYTQDIPILSTSTYAQYRVMKLASENDIKVLLDGQGADELFAGYDQHQYLHEISNNKLSGIIKSGFNKQTIASILRNSMLYEVLPRTKNEIRINLMLKYYHELNYINKDLVFDNIHILENHQHTLESTLNERLHHEYFNGYLKRLLKCEDRNSMRFSIESRTPFADDFELMNHALSIPAKFKIKNGTSKFVLREATKNYLPSIVYNRSDKKGFVTPNNKWLNDIKESLIPLVESCDSNIFNKKLLIKEADHFFSPSTTIENYRIFKFLSFMIWQKKFSLDL